MENLDTLKDVWKNQGESSIQFSANDLQSMVHKKSSSIVKWILIISILEFVLPNLLLLFTDGKKMIEIYDKYFSFYTCLCLSEKFKLSLNLRNIVVHFS